MKWILIGGMVIFGLIGMYSLPVILMPWADETLSRGLGFLVVFEALTIVGYNYMLYTILYKQEGE
jgi:hypothetical protein